MSFPSERLRVATTANGVQFQVKVVPGASRSAIAGVLGDALKVTVAAPPEAGRANDEVIALLSEALCVRAAAVGIVAGRTRPMKRVVVAGLTPAALRAALDPFLQRPRRGPY